MDYGIRRAITADWPSVQGVHERAAPAELHFVNETDRPQMASLRTVFRGDLWIAEALSQTLGFVACVGTDISWLYVDPSYFRRGVRRALLRHAVAHCGPIAHSTVLADNVACLALMASERFVLSGRETLAIPGYGEARIFKVRRIRQLSDKSAVSSAEIRTRAPIG